MKACGLHPQLRGAAREQSAEERPRQVPHPDTPAHRQQVRLGMCMVHILPLEFKSCVLQLFLPH